MFLFTSVVGLGCQITLSSSSRSMILFSPFLQRSLLLSSSSSLEKKKQGFVAHIFKILSIYSIESLPWFSKLLFLFEALKSCSDCMSSTFFLCTRRPLKFTLFVHLNVPTPFWYNSKFVCLSFLEVFLSK